VGKEGEVLKHHAEVARVGRHAGQVTAVEAHRATVGRLQPGDDAQQRRLATARRA